MHDSQPQEQRTDPETPLNESAISQPRESTPYTIRRKGSRYNIAGSHGRLFSTYKSASVVGPRWEELTHTPWPYRSSAYESGLRLWQLGLIERDQVGQQQLQPPSTASAEPSSTPADAGVLTSPAGQEKHDIRQASPLTGTEVLKAYTLVLALPAPRIDLEEQTWLIQALRHNPSLLFNAQVRTALEHEVEYHRPDARWAATLLKLLAR
ncbi:MAG TPA: hypothetical protein VMT24_00355, partial [Aggregatilineaceae bacterium]|nr:hypothetical protein [Aggregatilineaceae bacterium]